MNKNDLVQLYSSVLKEMGLVADEDKDGDVIFKYPELGTMFFSIDENDPEYLMLVFPNFADQNALKISREQLLSVMNTVNSKSKVVKIWAREDKDEPVLNVTATIEAFIAPPDTLPDRDLLTAVLKRNIASLRASVLALVKEARQVADQKM